MAAPDPPVVPWTSGDPSVHAPRRFAATMPPISTRDLTRLPDVDELRRLLQALAVLDAILSPDFEGRAHSFDAEFGEDEQLATFRTGESDGFTALFTPEGCFLKGWVADAPVAAGDGVPSSLFEALPEAFAGCTDEPALRMEETTFCIWRRADGDAWEFLRVALPHADDPDGSARLLGHLDGEPATYVAWAAERYGVEVDPETVRRIHAHLPLSQRMVQRLNGGASLEEVQDDAREIGYPLVAPTHEDDDELPLKRARHAGRDEDED